MLMKLISTRIYSHEVNEKIFLFIYHHTWNHIYNKRRKLGMKLSTRFDIVFSNITNLSINNMVLNNYLYLKIKKIMVLNTLI